MELFPGEMYTRKGRGGLEYFGKGGGRLLAVGTF